MEKLKKVAIIGGGPIGMMTAFYLKGAGCEVYLFDKDKVKINLIRNEGIIIQGTKEQKIFLKHVYSSLDEIEPTTFDLVIFSTKSYHTSSAGQEFKSYFGEHIVVSAQNGLETEDILKSVFGESNVLRMVINFAGNLNAPNVVKQTFFIPPNYIASADDSKKEIAQQFAEALTHSGSQTECIDSFSMLRQIWEKTILNSALSALCGITKMTMREVMSNSDMVELVEQTIQEAVMVAEAEKIHFDDDFIRKCLRYLKTAGNHFPSLAVDMINGRETEIDYFNGKIVRYGRKHYVKTPLNLMFYNIVRAQTNKSVASLITPDIKLAPTGKNGTAVKYNKSTPTYLGVDLGSSYTKITVIDDDGNILYKNMLKTLDRDKIAIQHVMTAIKNEFNIVQSCATGYGRKYFSDADITKTEINCAARAVNHYVKGEKTIIDIGGEDIKVIRCDKNGLVENFYLNDKCAAGTGSFISEIAEKVGLDIKEMNELAKHSNYNKPLNSFCTVFAKTEIMSWIFEGMPLQDVAKGVYLSIGSRVGKMRIDTGVPVVLIGGVIAHHAYFKEILEKVIKTTVHVVDNPQYAVSYGAALITRDYAKTKQEVKN